MRRVKQTERGNTLFGTLAFLAVLTFAIIISDVYLTSSYEPVMYVGKVASFDSASLTIQIVKSKQTAVVRDIKNIEAYRGMLREVREEKKLISINLNHRTRKFPPEDSFTIEQIVIVDP